MGWGGGGGRGSFDLGLFEEFECAGSCVGFGLEGGGYGVWGLWAMGVRCVGMSDPLRTERVERETCVGV